MVIRKLTVCALSLAVLGTVILTPCEVMAVLDSSYAAAYLRTGIGARALGMGGAFRSIADDGSAIYWNPGGNAFIEKKEVNVSYSALSSDRGLNFLSYTHPMSIGTFAVGLINSGVSGIKGYTSAGVENGDVVVSNNAFFLSYARKVGDIVGVGANVKILASQVQGNSGIGFGVDFGAVVQPIKNLAVGLMMQDIASSISWNTASNAVDSVGMNLALCASYKLFDSVNVAAGINKYSDYKNIGYNVGLEYMSEVFGFRAGLENNNPCAGFTVRIMNLVGLTYAYVSDPLNEGNSHIVTLDLRF
ncbi:MAG: PorV/PorQ family protein [Elusimicrobiota bacterium]